MAESANADQARPDYTCGPDKLGRFEEIERIAMNEEKILDAITQLGITMNNGFSEINGRFRAIEERLGIQEATTQATRQAQQLQSEEIRKLQEIVRQLAEDKPIRTMPNGTAIRKSDAYPLIEKEGFSVRKAMRSLRKAGIIQADHEAKSGKIRNTVNIRLDGRTQRVIVVIARDERM